MNKTETILVIFFSDEILDQMAEIEKVKVRMLDEGVTMKFQNHAEDMFEQF